MISFDFQYDRPESIEEAVRAFQRAESAGLEPIYYSGGTEIISMARLNLLRTGAVIDIKGIPECNEMTVRQDQFVIGSAITLTNVVESNLYPLLSETSRNVADFTNRNKITIGGNLCGKFYYREALLPFLLADSQVVLAGAGGLRQVSIDLVMNGEPRLEKGELLVQIISEARYLALPFITVKKTKQEKIDYPIVRVTGVRAAEGIRMAFSGVSEAAFRSRELEEVLNDTALPVQERIEVAIRRWPYPILNDILSSAAYRTFVLRNTLTDAMEALERRRL
jgi:CO/xanthine dehydrogenase FAD-binding subunit